MKTIREKCKAYVSDCSLEDEDVDLLRSGSGEIPF